MRDPASLKPNPKNPRAHSPEQIAMIRASIDEFGWTVPCVIDEKDKLWGGHGRALAAQLEPAIAEVPCVVARGWTPAQKTAYMLADNRIGEVSTWDRDLLRDHLKSLDGVFDLAKAGFDAIMLPQFLADPNAGRTDPDDIPPPPPQDPCVLPGDLWVLGEHRLICGDCTDRETVERLLDGVHPPLMASDPPYGVAYDPGWRYRVRRQDGSRVGARAMGEVKNDTRDDWSEAWALFPGNVAYIWHGGLHSATVQRSLESVGFVIRTQIIWAKKQFVIGRGDYHWQHECCWHAVRKGKNGNWQGDRKQSTLWDIAVPTGWSQIKEGADEHTGIHSTQKMVECMQRPILNNSKPGDAVYEPFSGSFTTGIACEISGRRCYAVEIAPEYVQLGILRWQKFSGKVATLNGATLEEVAAARGKSLAPVADPADAQ